MRMADEIDQGQANGEVRTRADNQHVQTSDKLASLDDIGVSRQRLSEWREVRDAGNDVVEGALSRAIAEGRSPTKAEILQAAREIRGEGDKKVRRAERERELGAKQCALPSKRYGVIVADPEWRFEPYSRKTGLNRSADKYYPTSSTELIAARDVASIAAADCVLFLWATAPMLPHALLVMGAWGFDYRSHQVWVKDKLGTGYWFRNQHELLLVGVRGDIPAPAPGENQPSVIGTPRGSHSEKPECFLESIEGLYPSLPKIELNRRGAPREGWDAWGLEATGHAEDMN
jgi:N6-adenosine-specific RNA methylase IME4